MLDRLFVEQGKRCSQLIAAATDFVDGQVKFSFQLLQLLPYGAATNTQCGTQRLP
ncbi:hypothetical protein D3C76_1069910 [compost metagenome]